MKKHFLHTLILILSISSVGFSKEDPTNITPLFQLSVGVVYSSIDLSHYNNSVSYRGFHARVVTHVKGMFSLSTEYSTFPVHNSPTAWENAKTHKLDLNGHFSFSTNNNLTHIFVLAGADNHDWTATRTGYTNISQMGDGIAQGTVVHINRWGLNFGCGFTQTLYENIGVFADYRFCFANAKSFEKVRIMDVMTTIGLNFTIPYPQKTNGKKTFGIGSKIYKWTRKGANSR